MAGTGQTRLGDMSSSAGSRRIQWREAKPDFDEFCPTEHLSASTKVIVSSFGWRDEMP